MMYYICEICLKHVNAVSNQIDIAVLTKITNKFSL